MGGSIRALRVTLTSLVLVAGYGWNRPQVAGSTAEPLPQAPAHAQAPERAGGTDPGKLPTPATPSAPGAVQTSGSGSRWQEVAPFFSQAGAEPPRPFVPLRPATLEDRRRTEAMRLYSAARALEDQRRWPDAVALLQQAATLDPDSLAIARRLSRIYIGALGRPDLALQHGRRVLALQPGDTETLSRLVDFFVGRNDSAGAEALLNEVLANPKLEAHSPGRLLALNELGKLYSSRLKQLDKAADAFAKVIAELDDKSANRLSASDLARVLGNDPATAYLNFGLIFLAAKRDDLAVKALERGLVYDEDNPQIALNLAETLLRLHQGERALKLVERAIQRQPQGV